MNCPLLLPLLSTLFWIFGDVGDGDGLGGVLLLAPFAILLVSIPRIIDYIFSTIYIFLIRFLLGCF
ncbi:MAG TPA: hypothetical protein VF242_00945 [Nitrososphaeraceae archaeon]